MHIHAGKTWLIDFQGMRGGRPEYDLASLVFDGYAHLETEQTDELLRNGSTSPGAPGTATSFEHAHERLMQMLGAYAQHRPQQRENLVSGTNPRGWAHLRRLLPGSMLAEPLAGMLE